jgi:hypothetical protein
MKTNLSQAPEATAQENGAPFEQLVFDDSFQWTIGKCLELSSRQFTVQLKQHWL